MNHFPAAPRPLARAVAAFALLSLLAPPARPADSPAPPRKVTAIEGITEYRLDNGLQVLLFPDRSTPTVTVNLTVLVGSRHEGYGETGMAHLLEHLVFKGTPSHADVPKALRDHGARFNGTTWVDRTNYYETMPARDENLEFALRLEADRLVNSFIRREDLVSEMTVVRNEFEMGENSPESVLSQRMTAVAYEWHNYGKSTIGNRSDIERVPIDRLQAFYRKFYQPDNAVLVVAGNFDQQKALQLVSKYFGPLKRPDRRLEATYTEEPPQDGERHVVLRRVGKVGLVGALYHIPAGAHEDFAAVEVLNGVLTSQPSGRLYRALVLGKKASTLRGSAYAWHDPGVLEILAEVEPANLEAARETLVSLLEKLPEEKFAEAEVERAKARLLKTRELLMADPGRVAITLSDWAAKGDWRLFFLHRDRLEKVTPDDVARVAARYLRPSNRTVGLYTPSDAPQRTPIPETPVVADLLKDYKGRQAVAVGEAFEPTPANIDRRTRVVDLPSGVKAALLPKKTRGEAVAVELVLRYGNPESLKGNNAAAVLLPELLTRGTRQQTRQQIEDRLDRLKARLSARGSVGEMTFTVETRRESLPAVLKLLGEMLREPSFAADEFDTLRRQYRDRFAKGLAEPTALAGRALRRKLSPYPKDDVRYETTVEESVARLDAVTLDQVRRLYAEQVGGRHGELAVVGDFDPEAVVAQVGELLKAWESPTRYERIARPAKEGVAGGKEVIPTPDKASAVYMAGLVLPLTDAAPEYAALKVGNFLLGGGTLSSRLGNRVRQKEGLSYGVGSQLTADSLDPSTPLMIFAISNPQNTAKVERAIADELEKFLREGVSAGELDEAKVAYLEQLKVQWSGDGALAGVLAENLEAGRSFTFYGELERKIAALTPDDVHAAFRKHVDPKKLVIVEAGDFRKE